MKHLFSVPSQPFGVHTQKAIWNAEMLMFSKKLRTPNRWFVELSEIL